MRSKVTKGRKAPKTMPEFVPFFEPKHFTIGEWAASTAYCATPAEWLLRVFGDRSYSSLEGRLGELRNDGPYFYVSLSQLEVVERENAAAAMNKLMAELGYAEPVSGRWTKRG